MGSEEIVYKTLNSLQIEFKKYEHLSVYTEDDAYKNWEHIRGSYTKNVFLRNRKGNRLFWVILDSKKNLNLRKLQERIGAGTLMPVSERKMEKDLGLAKNAVCIFSLVNDTKKTVEVVIDRSLTLGEIINFHPYVHTGAISITTEDFMRFFDWCSNKVSYFDFS